MSKSKSGNPKKNKAVKSVKDIKPQAPVDTKAVAVIEPPPHKVARSPLNFDWIKFENNLITENLIETVREHTEIIHTLLTSRRKLDIQIASELAILRNQFLAYAAKNELGKAGADEAFGEYVQAVFDIKASRASEYIRVAGKKALQDLKLPISSLCELARLNDEALNEFLEGYPPEELENMTFREVQVLVQDNNENRVTRKTTKSSRGGGGTSSGGVSKSTTAKVSASNRPTTNEQENVAIDIQNMTEVITGQVETSENIEDATVLRMSAIANLRVAFSELKNAVDKLGLDQITADLLAEISKYYESAQKKGGV